MLSTSFNEPSRLLNFPRARPLAAAPGPSEGSADLAEVSAGTYVLTPTRTARRVCASAGLEKITSARSVRSGMVAACRLAFHGQYVRRIIRNPSREKIL